MTQRTYYTVEIIRSRRATEREGLEYPAFEKTVSKDLTLEMAEFNYEHTFIGAETDKELRKITEENGQIIADELIRTTY